MLGGEHAESEKGLSPKPCSTSWLTGIDEEPLMVTNCFLLERDEYNQGKAMPGCSDRWFRRIPWETLSKAAEQSTR